jgi:hypothetical protein
VAHPSSPSVPPSLSHSRASSGAAHPSSPFLSHSSPFLSPERAAAHSTRPSDATVVCGWPRPPIRLRCPSGALVAAPAPPTSSLWLGGVDPTSGWGSRGRVADPARWWPFARGGGRPCEVVVVYAPRQILQRRGLTTLLRKPDPVAGRLDPVVGRLDPMSDGGAWMGSAGPW